MEIWPSHFPPPIHSPCESRGSRHHHHRPPAADLSRPETKLPGWCTTNILPRFHLSMRILGPPPSPWPRRRGLASKKCCNSPSEPLRREHARFQSAPLSESSCARIPSRAHPPAAYPVHIFPGSP